MSNNPDYDACIAAGNSDAVCRATFGPPEGEAETGNITSISQLANMQLFDLTRGGAPVRIRPIQLTGRTGPGGYNLEDAETGQRYFAANRVLVDTLGNAYQVSPGGDVTTGNPVQSRMLTQSERNAAVSAGIPLLGVPSGSSSYAPQAYGSTQAGQTQSEEAARIRQAEDNAAAAARLATDLEARANEARRNRDFQTAERLAGEAAAARAAAIAAENQLKLARLGEAGALARTFEDIKSRARDVIAGMWGKNPFRGAVRARGGIPRGVDPYEAFEAELKGVAAQPTPQFSSGSDLGQLDAAIAAMQKTQMPTAAWPTRSMAAGGTVRPGEVVKVGEVGEEYVYNRGGGEVEVIPKRGGARVAGRAQYGGTYSFDESSIGQALSPVYSYMGFGGMPTIGPSPGGGVQVGGGGSAGNLATLGIKPRMVRDVGTGGIYYVDPEGNRRWISSPAHIGEWGFDPSDIVNMSTQEMEQMWPGVGPTLTEAPSMVEPYQGGYPAQATPLRLPPELGGYALPYPRTIANLFRTFDPANRELLLDALELSEMGRGQIQSLFGAYTPAGTAGRVGFG